MPENGINGSPLRNWIEAFRLRTLPLAFSSTLMGGLMAIANNSYRWLVILLALLTTLFLQILSNLANDYGDSIKGTDNQNRVGPLRSVQSGNITQRAMKSAVILLAILSFSSGIVLLYFSLGNRLVIALLFFVAGIAAIIAAIKYTVGTKAYGYHRLGDIFVFLFFGLTGVLGTYYLNALTMPVDMLLPAISIGLFSVGVLNLNNMRDIDNDRASGKNTIASSLGYPRARRYHLLIIVTGWVAATAYLFFHYTRPVNLLFYFTLPLFIKDVFFLFKTKNKAHLDPFLKKLAISTFLFSLLFGLSFIL